MSDGDPLHGTSAFNRNGFFAAMQLTGGYKALRLFLAASYQPNYRAETSDVREAVEIWPRNGKAWTGETR